LVEGLGFSQGLYSTVEGEFLVGEGLLEEAAHFGAEETAEDFDGEEEAGTRGDPAGVVGRESAAGDEAVEVRVEAEVLSPRVEDSEKGDLSTQVLGISGDL
jgi:hypothetical protein